MNQKYEVGFELSRKKYWGDRKGAKVAKRWDGKRTIRRANDNSPQTIRGI